MQKKQTRDKLIVVINQQNYYCDCHVDRFKILIEKSVYVFLNRPKLLDNAKSSRAIFINLAKEFASLCYKKLLDKPYQLGFCGKISDILRRYLTEHSQRARRD